mgnify:CR=1 FL=1
MQMDIYCKLQELRMKILHDSKTLLVYKTIFSTHNKRINNNISIYNIFGKLLNRKMTVSLSSVLSYNFQGTSSISFLAI